MKYADSEQLAKPFLVHSAGYSDRKNGQDVRTTFYPTEELENQRTDE